MHVNSAISRAYCITVLYKISTYPFLRFPELVFVTSNNTLQQHHGEDSSKHRPAEITY